jgi:hypothetical protein
MNEREPLSFPDWREALATVALSPAEREAYRREILAFLHLCKVRRAPATVMLAKEYLADRERQGAMEARPRLRWFFQAGRARLTAVARDPRPALAGRALTAQAAAGDVAAFLTALAVESRASPSTQRPAGSSDPALHTPHGKSPRAALASATRPMPSVSAARRRLNLNFRCWASTEFLARSSITHSFARTSSRLQ